MRSWLVRVLTEDGDIIASGVFRGGKDKEAARQWAKGLWIPPKYERDEVTFWVEVIEVNPWSKLW